MPFIIGYFKSDIVVAFDCQYVKNKSRKTFKCCFFFQFLQHNSICSSSLFAREQGLAQKAYLYSTYPLFWEESIIDGCVNFMLLPVTRRSVMPLTGGAYDDCRYRFTQNFYLRVHPWLYCLNQLFLKDGFLSLLVMVCYCCDEMP